MPLGNLLRVRNLEISMRVEILCNFFILISKIKINSYAIFKNNPLHLESHYIFTFNICWFGENDF